MPLIVASPETVNVFEGVPPAMVNPVAVAVGVNPLILVAVATPNVGVTKVGLVNVLFVKVSVPAKVAKVPVVGSVTFEFAVVVIVVV